jgi:hypothetical protein
LDKNLYFWLYDPTNKFVTEETRAEWKKSNENAKPKKDRSLIGVDHCLDKTQVELFVNRIAGKMIDEGLAAILEDTH